MKKTLLLAILLFATTSVMGAKVGDTIVSFEFGGLKSDATIKVNGVSSDGDISTTYQQVKVGKYYDFGRLGVSAGIMNEEARTDGYFIGSEYNYMFYNESKLVPFVGASLAYSWNEARGTGYTLEHDGFMYGVNAGAVYEITDKIELEIGARYLESDVDGDTTVAGTKISLEVDSVIQYYLSVGYKF